MTGRQKIMDDWKKQGMQKGRRTELDIAKGIGIILVVWAHANGPFTDYIVQFHMPFFFFISGMLYREPAFGEGKEYIFHKCKSLLVPFWFWNFILYPVFFTLFYWRSWSFDTCLQEILQILFTVDKVPFLGATWFLPALFWISIGIDWIIRKTCKFKFQDIILLGVGICVCELGFHITFPYRISRILVCTLFYICGYFYRKYIENAVGNKVQNVTALLCGVIFIMIARCNSVSLDSNEYQSRIAFIIGAVLATVFILRMSLWVSKCKIETIIADHLAYIGRKSLCIVIWHLLAFRAAILLQIFLMHIGIESLVSFPVYDTSGIWWGVYLVTGIYLSLFWQYILEHNSLSSFMRKTHII